MQRVHIMVCTEAEAETETVRRNGEKNNPPVARVASMPRAAVAVVV